MLNKKYIYMLYVIFIYIADLAQLVERFFRKEKVGGSTPSFGREKLEIKNFTYVIIFK